MTALAFAPFLNGWALAGLGAALTAVPILIHLLNRRRVRVVRWAAMTWLLAALKRHQRRLKLENWLILALRVAAVLLLGIALARPVLTDSALAGLAGQKRSVYLLLDTSASTGARREARSVSDAVKAEAALVLESLSAEDAFAVVVSNDTREEAGSGRSASVLVPRTAGSSSVDRAKELVAALPVREAPADWVGALDATARQLADEDVNRQVVVVSDLTARDWTLGEALRRASERLSALVRRGCRLVFVDVGGPIARRGNLALADIEVRSDRPPFQGRTVPLSVRVQNLGPEPVEGALVTVEVRGRSGEAFRRARLSPRMAAADPATGKPGVAAVDVDVPPGALREPGTYVVRASVGPPGSRADADVLALDSTRYLPLVVRSRVRVLAWVQPCKDAQPGALELLRPTFDPEPPPVAPGAEPPPAVFELEALEGNVESSFAQRLAGAGRPFDLVVLANVAPRNPVVLEALRAFVRDGGALLAFAGDALEPRMWNEPFHAVPAEQRLLPYAVLAAELRPPLALPPEPPFRLDLLTRSEAAWAGLFTGPEVAVWLGALPPVVTGRMRFQVPAPAPRAPGEPPAPAEAGGAPGVVLRWVDGQDPAIVEGRLGLGRTLWVGTSVDQGWLELGAPFFLPVLLEEAALHLTEPEETPRSVLVGQPLEAYLPRQVAGERLAAPGGKDVPLRRLPGTAGSARPHVLAEATGFSGPWRLTWKEAEGTGAEDGTWFAVNPDPQEGALLPADRRALGSAAGPEASVVFLESYRGQGADRADVREGEVTRLVLGVLLGLLVLESLLAWLFGRRAGPSESLAEAQA